MAECDQPTVIASAKRNLYRWRSVVSRFTHKYILWQGSNTGVDSVARYHFSGTVTRYNDPMSNTAPYDIRVHLGFRNPPHSAVYQGFKVLLSFWPLGASKAIYISLCSCYIVKAPANGVHFSSCIIQICFIFFTRSIAFCVNSFTFSGELCCFSPQHIPSAFQGARLCVQQHTLTFLHWLPVKLLNHSLGGEQSYKEQSQKEQSYRDQS